MITALALDPGRTTGYAIAHKDDSHFYVSYDQAEMDHTQLWEFIPLDVDYIICESFNYRHTKDKADLYPCELIGVVKLWVQFHGAELIMQDPSIQGKSAYFSDAKLKQLDLYKKGEAFHHGRSAVKHLLQFFAFGPGFQYQTPTELVAELC